MSVLLRRWRIADASALWEARHSDGELTRQLPPFSSLDEVEQWISSVSHEMVFALVVDDVACGQVAALYPDLTHGTRWFSYWSHPAIRGRGLTSRAAASVASWLLSSGQTRRLELGYRTNNPASGVVARKAGFIHEGVERGKLVYDGIAYDVNTMSRLVSDPVPVIEAIEIEF